MCQLGPNGWCEFHHSKQICRTVSADMRLGGPTPSIKNVTMVSATALCLPLTIVENIRPTCPCAACHVDLDGLRRPNPPKQRGNVTMNFTTHLRSRNRDPHCPWANCSNRLTTLVSRHITPPAAVHGAATLAANRFFDLNGLLVDTTVVRLLRHQTPTLQTHCHLTVLCGPEWDAKRDKNENWGALQLWHVAQLQPQHLHHRTLGTLLVPQN